MSGGKFEPSAQDLIRGGNQARVLAWVIQTFGVEMAQDGPERTLRVVEEVVELAQAAGISKEVVSRVVDYVFERPVGAVEQEVAGSLVTLYAAASALGVDAEAEFERELARISDPVIVERCRRRQAEKRKALVGR